VAREAFTVGASDKADAIADFSSWGPVHGFYELIKPDIVAPGVDISSTYLDGEYRPMEGTSMSTPHVAGCAALIKQLHPSWSPRMIKANLMNTARAVGRDVFTQGAGRVQVNDAAGAQAVLLPSSVGFGLVNAMHQLWTQSRTLQLTNVGTSALDCSLTVSATMPTGVTTHLQPDSVTLTAGESVSITFAITVDNRTTPYLPEEPGSYEGQLIARTEARGDAQGVSEAKTLVVTFAVLKPAVRAPGLIAPRRGFYTDDHDIVFHWEAVPSATHYRIQVDTGDTFTSTNLLSDTVGSESYAANLGMGVWYWHVLAIDAEGTESAYSDMRAIVVAEPVVQLTTDTAADGRPSITEAADSRLWVVWSSERSGDADLWYKTSSDRGATWSPATRVTLDPAADLDPAVTGAADGTLWVVWASDRSGNSDIWYKTSSDGGATWSDAAQLTTDPSSDSQPGITQTSDGTLWVVWASGRSGSSDVWYKSSNDSGLTWSTESQLPTGTGSNRHPAITETSQGILWVTWASGYDVWSTTSSDGGGSWSAKRSLAADPPYCEAHQPMIVEGGEGTLWLTWSRLWFMIGEKYRTGSDVMFKTSSDSGTTWSYDAWWSRFMGYNDNPALAALGDGAVAAVWGSNRWGNSDVWFGVFGQHADVNPPPYLDNVMDDTFPGVFSDETVTIGAYVDDEAGVESVHVIWTRNGTPQTSLEMYDDGTRGDRLPQDRWWHLRLGPFPAGTEISYQVRAVDVDGNVVTGPVVPNSFIVLQRPTPTPCPVPVEDTYVYRWTPDSNYCSENQLKVGHRQQYAALLRFDLSHIPANATVTYARLELWATGWDGTNMDVEVYRILRDTSLCQATWNQAQDGNPWGIAGCNDTLTDRAAEPEACKRTSGVNTQLAFTLTDLVQDWVSGTLDNNGILLRGASELSASLFEFGSVEHSDENVRPRLVVYYEVEGEPTATPTQTPTATHTPTAIPTIPMPTSTPTPTSTSIPGPPTLIEPQDEAVLPQPVAPQEWLFTWDACRGPCLCYLVIEGPGGRYISQDSIPPPTTGYYQYHYTQDAYLPDDAVGPWYWHVSVCRYAQCNASERRSFWVRPAHVVYLPIIVQ
jgi:hypothetical protein